MKKWKILALVPYILVIAWVAFWLSSFGKFGLVSVILVPVFIIWGIAAAVIYTVILVMALIVVRIVKKRAGKKELEL